MADAQEPGVFHTRDTGENEALTVDWIDDGRPLRCEFNRALLGEEGLRELKELLHRIASRGPRSHESAMRGVASIPSEPHRRRLFAVLKDHPL